MASARPLLVALAFTSAPSTLALAQSQTTTCDRVGTSVECRTREDAWGAYIRDQQARSARNAQQAAARAQQQAAEEARLARRAAEDAAMEARLRAIAEKSAADSRAKAQWNAFLPRARMILTDVRDSLNLGTLDQDAFWKEGSSALLTLFEANPLAANKEIREQVEPIRREWAGKAESYWTMIFEEYTRAADSLGVKKWQTKAFGEVVAPVVDSLFGEPVASDRSLTRTRIDRLATSRRLAWASVRPPPQKPAARSTGPRRP